MNVFSFADVNPADPESVRVFLDDNALAHIAIHNALLEQGSVTPASPLTYEAIGEDFLEVNSQECRAWAGVLSLTIPPNLSTVDPENEGEMRDWFNDYQLFLLGVQSALGLS